MEKPGLAIAILKGKKPSDDEEEDGVDFEGVAQEILDAIDGGDAGGLAESLKNFVSLCNE